MVPYYVLVFVPYLFSLILKRDNYEEGRFGRRVTLFVFFFIFTLLLAFRTEACGTDLPGYKEHFAAVQYNTWEYGLTLESEPGYFYLQKLVHVISDNFYVYLAVVALISVVPWVVFYMKESDNAVLSIAAFIAVAPFSMYFSGLRQAVAMGFSVIVWHCVRKKKWFWFAVSVLLAMSVHASGWVIALILPLYYIRITKKYLPAIGILATTFLVFNKRIMEILTEFLGRYSETIKETNAYTVLILLIIFVIYAFFLPDESKMDRDTIAMRNMLIFTLLVQCFAPAHLLVMRVNYYFLPFIPVFVTRVAHRSRYELEQVSTISAIVMVVVFTAWFLGTMTRGGALGIVPYTTWLF